MMAVLQAVRIDGHRRRAYPHLTDVDPATAWAPWVKRQGLNPEQIPLDSVIEVDDDMNEISFDEWYRGADGNLVKDDLTGLVRVHRTVKLDRPVEPFPEEA